MLQSTLFEETVKKYPNFIAIDDHGKKTTYLQLNEKANQIANFISQITQTHNAKVSILSKKNINLYSSILGLSSNTNLFSMRLSSSLHFFKSSEFTLYLLFFSSMIC